MFLPVLSSVLILVLIIALVNKRNQRRIDDGMKAFWEKERAANSVRRQSLDGLDYINIPESFFSFPRDASDHDCSEAVRMLESLRGEKIVNLSGISNTDLKLKYGPANLPDLSRFDENYTSLARSLQLYASFLAKKGCRAEACEILEFALGTDTDVTASYRLLCSLYLEAEDQEKAESVLARAKHPGRLGFSSLVSELQALIDRAASEN